MHINLLFAISGGVLHKNLALLLGKGGIVAITLLVTAAVAGHFLYNGRAARLVKSSEKIRAPNSVWIGWIIILWTFFVPFLCVLIYGSLQHR